MAEWDDDNFEPQELTGLSNKWEGEDEDDDVKENWEDEEEEKKTEEVVEVKQKPKKKTLQDKIAEKERLKRDEHEKRMKEQQEEEEEISPEEQLRRQKESDLKLALETTFGVSNKSSDGVQLTGKEELQELAETLTRNIQQLAKSEEYPAFAENLIRGVCATLNSFDLKKIKTTIDNMYLEKQKLEKGEKAKKSKGKGKAKLKLEGDNLNQYSAYVDDYDEYDDFM